jgi:DNA-3-methyladenine glycosylase II
VAIRLPTRGPFHLEATVRVLQRRPANRVDVWSDGRYRRVIDTGEGPLLAEVVDRGTVAAPDLRCTLHGVHSASARHTAARTLRRVLGLDLDPVVLRRVAEREPAMRATARELRGLRPPRFSGLFEAFASVVPYQQVSIDAGIAVLGRTIERFGEALVHEGERYYAFPTPAAIVRARPRTLRACGLSAQKTRTLQMLARAIDSGALDERELDRLSSEAAGARLVALRGVGPWTAGLVLLRGLGRLDVFPPGDVGAARSLRALLGTTSTKEIDATIERFGTLRGYLYFCALGGRLLTRGLINPPRSGAKPVVKIRTYPRS